MSKAANATRYDTQQFSHFDLTYPWKSPETPLADEIEIAAREWVLERGLLPAVKIDKRCGSLNIGLLTALTYSGAPLSKLIIISKLLTWIFIHDDYYDATLPPDIGQLQKKLRGYAQITREPVITSSPNVNISTLSQLMQSIAKSSGPDWIARFANSMNDFWFSGVLVETSSRAQKIVLDLDAYVRMRRYSLCIFPMLDLVEYAHGFVLPRQIVEDPALLQIKQLTAELTMYTNDILSYGKEQKAGDPNNLIHVLMHHEKMDFSSAVSRAVQMHDLTLSRFIEKTDSLPAWWGARSPYIAKYIDGCRAWIRGALDWQLLAPRYATGRVYLENNTTTQRPTRPEARETRPPSSEEPDTAERI
jgi:5-epi-alpha-selinene synthase